MEDEWAGWPSYGYALGKRLVALRAMRGLSQERLADLSGVSRNQISNLERNSNNGSNTADPTLSTIYKLARALFVPPAVLLPDPGIIVDGICREDGSRLQVDIHWPRSEHDVLAFDPRYVVFGRLGGVPMFGLHANRPLQALLPGVGNQDGEAVAKDAEAGPNEHADAEHSGATPVAAHAETSAAPATDAADATVASAVEGG